MRYLLILLLPICLFSFPDIPFDDWVVMPELIEGEDQIVSRIIDRFNNAPIGDVKQLNKFFIHSYYSRMSICVSGLYESYTSNRISCNILGEPTFKGEQETFEYFRPAELKYNMNHNVKVPVDGKEIIIFYFPNGRLILDLRVCLVKSWFEPKVWGNAYWQTNEMAEASQDEQILKSVPKFDLRIHKTERRN